LLGVDPNFPIIDSLTLLTAIAARTKRIKLSTGILVLPLRNPVVLAKQLSSMDLLSGGRLLMAMAAGWYKREFDAIGVPFEQRGKIMGENLDILKRFWTEDMVEGEWTNHKVPAGVMYPKPAQKPRPPILIGGYVDRVLKRAAVEGDGWLTYFYKPDCFARSWAKVRNFAIEAGKDPDTLMNGSQLPIMVGKSRSEVEGPMMDWLNKEWDIAQGSESSLDSAIMGTVDECVEQLKEHLKVGVQKIVFVPYKYEMEQVEIIAREIIPRLREFQNK
jgi:alkanesulfonate monooxygenase